MRSLYQFYFDDFEEKAENLICIFDWSLYMLFELFLSMNLLELIKKFFNECPILLFKLAVIPNNKKAIFFRLLNIVLCQAWN